MLTTHKIRTHNILRAVSPSNNDDDEGVLRTCNVTAINNLRVRSYIYFSVVLYSSNLTTMVVFLVHNPNSSLLGDDTSVKRH
jgi:hypothetical protein